MSGSDVWRSRGKVGGSRVEAGGVWRDMEVSYLCYHGRNIKLYGWLQTHEICGPEEAWRGSGDRQP